MAVAVATRESHSGCILNNIYNWHHFERRNLWAGYLTPVQVFCFFFKLFYYLDYLDYLDPTQGKGI